MLYEPILRENLIALAKAYGKARGLAMDTVARRLCKDSRFFRRIDVERRTFTALQYDRIVAQFSSDWPVETEWPTKVPRPSASQIRSVMGRPIQRKEEQMSWQKKPKKSPKAASTAKTSKGSSKKPSAKKAARKSSPAVQAATSETKSTSTA